MGIEPTSKAWEAFVLPLNYTREFSCLCNHVGPPAPGSHPALCAGPCSTLHGRPLLKLGKLSFCH